MEEFLLFHFPNQGNVRETSPTIRVVFTYLHQSIHLQSLFTKGSTITDEAHRRRAPQAFKLSLPSFRGNLGRKSSSRPVPLTLSRLQSQIFFIPANSSHCFSECYSHLFRPLRNTNFRSTVFYSLHPSSHLRMYIHSGMGTQELEEKNVRTV